MNKTNKLEQALKQIEFKIATPVTIRQIFPDLTEKDNCNNLFLYDYTFPDNLPSGRHSRYERDPGLTIFNVNVLMQCSSAVLTLDNAIYSSSLSGDLRRDGRVVPLLP